MDFIFSYDVIASFLTLTLLEIVLGIDNLIFLSVLTNKLPPEKRNITRKVGLLFAMISRLVLLLAVNWLSQLKGTLFVIFSIDISIHSLIMLLGGIFLVYKAVGEIHHDIEGEGAAIELTPSKTAMVSFWGIIAQVMVLDMIFSIDSVITAVGMTNNYNIMASAIVISMLVMIFAATPLSNFVANHPTVKMLALSFLILVGVMLMAEGIGKHVDKGYLYFAIGFSMLVESLNIAAAKKKRKSKVKQKIKV